jgi:hypothetical protein
MASYTLASFDQNFQRRKDVETLALSNMGLPGRTIGEADLHCQGYAGEGRFTDIKISCRISKGRTTFMLNDRRIAAHKIAIQLGNLGALA